MRMEHVTSPRRLELGTTRPDAASAFAAALRTAGRLGSWLARGWNDPIGDRLERQREYDAQLLRRYDRPPVREG